MNAYSNNIFFMQGKLLQFLGVLAIVSFAWLSVPCAAAQVLLGDQTVESSLDTNIMGQAEAFQTTAMASGTVGSLSVYLDAQSTATKLYLGLYADNGGHPGTLLTQSSSTALVSGAWNTMTVSPVGVLAGTRYWLTILGTTSGTPYFRDRSPGSCASETSSQTSLTSLPATWSTGSIFADCPLSAYATAVTSPNPVLSVAPLNVAFTATPSGSNPAPATVNVTNTGSGTLNFTASSDSAWLTVAPTSGTAPQALQVSVSASGLSLGAYTGHVTVTAPGVQGSPAVVNVFLTVAKPADWPTVDHDPSRTGNAVDETTITTSNAGNLQLNWSVPVDGPVTAQPLFIAGFTVNGQTHDVVVVGTGGNSVYALDAATGATLWKRNFGSQSGNCSIPGGFGVTGAPVVDRNAGRVYAVSDDGFFHTLSLADGSDASTAFALVTDPATDKVWSGLNLVGNNIYVATASDGCDTPPWHGMVYRVDVSGAPVLASSFLVVPGLSLPNTGGGIWGYGGVAVDPSTGQVYAGSGSDSNELYTPYGDRVIALDSSLNLLGSYGPPEPSQFPCDGTPCDLDFGASPAVFQPNSCSTMTAIGNKNGNLYLFRTTDLTSSAQPFQVLTLNIPNDSLGSGGVGGVPAWWQAGQMLFVTDAGTGANGIQAGIVALTVTPGCSLQVAWSHALSGDDMPNSTATVANGVVFVGEGLTGIVHAYDAVSGAQLWTSGSTAYAPAATFAAPSVAQGSLYVGSWADFAGSGVVGAFSLNSTTQILSVSPTTVSFTAAQGGSNPASATVNVSNSGSGALNFTAASDSSWLGVTPGSGTAPQALQASANISGLSQGTYTGHITVTSTGAQGSPATVTVTLTITAPVPILSVSPTAVPFSGTQGGSNPAAATVHVANAGAGTLNFTAASDSAWLTIAPTSGTAPKTVKLTAKLAGLAQGTYTGHVTITAAGAQGSPATVTATLTVTAGTVLFGDTGIELQADSNPNGTAEAFQTTATTSGTLKSLTVYLDPTSAATKVVVGLYTDKPGHPGTRLAQGSGTRLTPGAWNIVALSPTTVAVTAGTKYWIAILGTGGGTAVFRDLAQGSCSSETSRQANLITLPTTWTSGRSFTECPISGYGK